MIDALCPYVLLYFSGLVAIRYGSQTIDPVTGLLAPVVGARLDVYRKNVVPITASYWMMMAEQTDSAQVEEIIKTFFFLMNICTNGKNPNRH